MLPRHDDRLLEMIAACCSPWLRRVGRATRLDQADFISLPRQTKLALLPSLGATLSSFSPRMLCRRSCLSLRSAIP